jgi:hypothetical protein
VLEGARPYGLLQLSDKAGGADFTEEDADNIRELAAFAGATLDALRAATRAIYRPGRIGTCPDHSCRRWRPSLGPQLLPLNVLEA